MAEFMEQHASQADFSLSWRIGEGKLTVGHLEMIEGSGDTNDVARHTTYPIGDLGMLARVIHSSNTNYTVAV